MTWIPVGSEQVEVVVEKEERLPERPWWWPPFLPWPPPDFILEIIEVIERTLGGG